MSSAALHQNGLQSTKRKKSKRSRSQPWLTGDDSYTMFSPFGCLLMNIYSQQKKLQKDMTNFGLILKKLQEDMTNVGTLVAEKDVASHYRFDGPIGNLQISGGKSLFSLEVK